MEWLLGITAFGFAILYISEHIRFQKQKKNMIDITEELDHFSYCPSEPHLENLDEGYFANMYNQISKLEVQVLDMKENADVREQEMINFIENMAHQVKNTLTSLQIQIDLLDICVDENQKRYLLKCQDSVNRLTWEIDRLLKSSQLAEGKIVMLDEQINITEEVEKVIAALSSIADERNVNIKVAAANVIEYSGDKFWISQAIENVLKNAIEHTDTGGVINVDIAKKNSMVIIRIEDSGDGIIEQEIENVFRRFYRGNGNKTGYGIGLSMAKDIVEAHHGSIQAGNNLNKGAWFEIKLLCLDSSEIYR